MSVTHGYPARLVDRGSIRDGRLLGHPQRTLPEHYWPAILPLRFLLVNILTWILLAIVILLAVWLPASKAAEMEPAEALRYDG